MTSPVEKGFHGATEIPQNSPQSEVTAWITTFPEGPGAHGAPRPVA